jgi:hypothetical protein
MKKGVRSTVNVDAKRRHVDPDVPILTTHTSYIAILKLTAVICSSYYDGRIQSFSEYDLNKLLTQGGRNATGSPQ